MALTRTTLSSAYAVGDNQIVVASATGFAADYIVRIDDQFFVVQKNYQSGTTVPVRGGQLGSKSKAHVATAGVVVGTASDWGVPGPGAVVNSQIAGRPRVVESLSATGTLTLAPAGVDQVVILNGTGAITLTIPVPTKDKDGDLLFIAGNGAAAHLYTFTGGLNGAGASYDILTGNATPIPFLVAVMAINGAWMVPTCPAFTGTVTSLVAGIA